MLALLICFNRTLVELKLGNKRHQGKRYQSFNRTLVELKFKRA